jgi:predicted AAA+ superfamily ATPase
MRAFERPVTTRISSERCGRYLENAIGARFIEAGWDVFYWRDRKLEVDFVVHGPQGEKWAVEVKSAAVDEKELVGIRTFCRLNRDYEPCLISLKTQAFSGIRSISVEDVLGFSRTARS